MKKHCVLTNAHVRLNDPPPQREKSLYLWEALAMISQMPELFILLQEGNRRGS